MSVEPVQDEAHSILLVDDNPTNLQVLSRTLNGGRARLLAARGGEQALGIARKAHPDLILLDVMMPGMDGYEVCRRLKADPETRDAAVIFLSALDETEAKVKGLELGAADYITKPFQADEVIARVEAQLTVQHLRRRLAERNQELEQINARINRDLKAAAQVQRSLLPASTPRIPGVEAAWEYRPCEELAGDALNLVPLDERHLAVYVVDVCGHGVTSALLSVMVTRSLSPQDGNQSVVREVPDGRPAAPAEVARRLNVLYPMDFDTRLYFTLLYGVLDLQTHRFRFVSAGNPGPVRVRANGDSEFFDVPAIPIGLLPDSQYHDSEIQLQSGDRLYLHSDGLNEERDGDGREYGRERLCRCLERAMGSSLADSVTVMVTDVVQWRGSEALQDDVAIVALEME